MLLRTRWAIPVAATVLAWALASSAAAAPTAVSAGSAVVGSFESAGGCGCHSTLSQQWAQSMHAQALSDPIFRAKLDEANAASDGKLGAFCLKCHGPNATMVGDVSSADMSQASSEGITCMFCHQVVGLAEGEPGNTSQLLELDGTRRAQLEDPQARHPAAYSEVHTRSAICGGCHNVNHPINGMHLESTFREWAESPYAEEGVACQDCHMSREPGIRGPSTDTAANGGPQRDNIYYMTFTGANAILGPRDAAITRLKNSATVEIEIAEVVTPGSEASVTVTTSNTGAGHYLPTGLTEVREMWLEVTATDASGTVVTLGEHRFGTILEDAKGNAPAELWDAVAIKSDDRIPPRESVVDTFTFRMPEGADASTLKAALYYRSVPEELAKKAGVDNPTTEMASAEARVFASEQAATAALAEPLERRSGRGVMIWLVLGVLALFATGWIVARSRGRTLPR